MQEQHAAHQMHKAMEFHEIGKIGKYSADLNSNRTFSTALGKAQLGGKSFYLQLVRDVKRLPRRLQKQLENARKC